MSHARIAACMGGWCQRREKCPHHFAVSGTPAERLCLPGQDGVILADMATGATMPLPAISCRVRRVAAIPPLKRALGTGEPATLAAGEQLA